MNPHVFKVYESSFAKESAFGEELSLEDSEEHLHKGMLIGGENEYTKETDYEPICNSIKKKMAKFGIQLIIKSNHSRTRKKSLKRVRYVQVGCAFAKHVRDGTLQANREKKVFGGKSGKSRKTSSKRIATCPFNLNLIWDSKSCKWKVGKLNVHHEGHCRMDTVSTPLNEEMKIVISRLRNDDGLSVQGTMNQMERMFGLKLTQTNIIGNWTSLKNL